MPHDHAAHAHASASTPPLPAAEDLLLLFADISGYTRFIRDNPYDLAHATWIVNQLIEAVTAALAPAFRLVKLEGDAAFCAASARPPGSMRRWWRPSRPSRPARRDSPARTSAPAPPAWPSAAWT